MNYYLTVFSLLYKIELNPSIGYQLQDAVQRNQHPEDEKFKRIAQALAELHEATIVEEQASTHLFWALSEKKHEDFETKYNQIETLTRLHNASLERFNKAKLNVIELFQLSPLNSFSQIK